MTSFPRGGEQLSPLDARSPALQKLPPMHQKVFVPVGTALLTLLAVVPTWNASEMLGDRVNVFFNGTAEPMMLAIGCVGTVFLYFVTSTCFFNSAHTQQSVLLIGSVFISLLGLVLVTASLPLERRSLMTSNSLMVGCRTGVHTHHLYEYSMGLQQLRAQPDCKWRFSIEECKGFVEFPPYTQLLREIENRFRCSGFCYDAFAEGAVVLAVVPSFVETQPAVPRRQLEESVHIGASLLQIQHTRHRNGVRQPGVTGPGNVTALVAASGNPSNFTSRELLSASYQAPAKPSYPPTLFSDAGYQASCQGMLARHTQSVAGDFAFQLFYQGVFLIAIAVAAGFAKLLGHCTNRK